MDKYDAVCQDLAQKLALKYSTSFGTASKFLGISVRPHVYNIYAWVHIADEIVDTYRGKDALKCLDTFHTDTKQAIRVGYSTNPIIHAYAQTVRKFDIDKKLVDAFITSMRMDLSSKRFTAADYKTYLAGSAESVGLMCLRIFTYGSQDEYKRLRPGAEALADAFQKVNFLRDFASDTKNLGRSYFPQIKGHTLTEHQKQMIVHDIRHDFTHAIPVLDQLPDNSRIAVKLTARYYLELLNRLEAAPVEVLLERRVCVPDWRKAQLLAAVTASHQFKRSTA